MARFRARGWLATLGLVVLTGGCAARVSGQNHPEAVRNAAVPAPPPQAPPGRPPVVAAVVVPAPRPAAVPRLWPFIRLFNVDYIDLRVFAEHYGLRTVWVSSGRVMQLVDGHARARLRFEDHSRDFHFDGIRVFLGEPVVFYKGSLFVAKIDVIKTLAPLLDPAENAHPLPSPPRTIAVDAGHGGTDDGTTNKRLKVLEKNVTLDTAIRLQKLLQSRGYRVVMTRTEDRYVGLEQRADIANRAHADLFISIHFNSLEKAPGVSGTETYVLTPQFQASTQPEKDRAMIPAFYPGNRADHWNTVFGFQLHRQLLADLQTPDRGLKRARWVVLRLTDCPGVLVESAYLSNEAEARRVATPEYRQRIAEAIARGVEDYAAVLASLRPVGAAPETRSPPAPSH